MKELGLGSTECTTVFVADDPMLGNRACHEYYISRSESPGDFPAGELGFIKFQEGPIKESGINGCHNEDLINIVIHRLLGFQSGDFKCRENALALTKLEEAIMWLNKRTSDRNNRGVVGTNKI